MVLSAGALAGSGSWGVLPPLDDDEDDEDDEPESAATASATGREQRRHGHGSGRTGASLNSMQIESS